MGLIGRVFGNRDLSTGEPTKNRRVCWPTMSVSIRRLTRPWHCWPSSRISRSQAAESRQPHLARSFHRRRCGQYRHCLAVRHGVPLQGLRRQASYGQNINAGIDYVFSRQRRTAYSTPRAASGTAACTATALRRSCWPELQAWSMRNARKRSTRSCPRPWHCSCTPSRSRTRPIMPAAARYNPDSRDSDLSLTGWAIMALRAGRLNGRQSQGEHRQRREVHPPAQRRQRRLRLSARLGPDLRADGMPCCAWSCAANTATP